MSFVEGVWVQLRAKKRVKSNGQSISTLSTLKRTPQKMYEFARSTHLHTLDQLNDQRLPHRYLIPARHPHAKSEAAQKGITLRGLRKLQERIQELIKQGKLRYFPGTFVGEVIPSFSKLTTEDFVYG